MAMVLSREAVRSFEVVGKARVVMVEEWWARVPKARLRWVVVEIGVAAAVERSGLANFVVLKTVEAGAPIVEI